MFEDTLARVLKGAGADLVGIGDLRSVPDCTWPTGIAVAVRVPSSIVKDLRMAPTAEYYDAYYELNAKLNGIVETGARFLEINGYRTCAQTTRKVVVDENNVSRLPHKTVATRAGLGWIGKSCLLVTPEYGSAVRISSLLTDAPLRTADAIDESQCGACTSCVKACPAQALSGALWKAGMERAQIVDIDVCYEKQCELMREHTGIDTDLCGKCFAVCPYTLRYLRTLSE